MKASRCNTISLSVTVKHTLWVLVYFVIFYDSDMTVKETQQYVAILYTGVFGILLFITVRTDCCEFLYALEQMKFLCFVSGC